MREDVKELLKNAKNRSKEQEQKAKEQCERSSIWRIYDKGKGIIGSTKDTLVNCWMMPPYYKGKALEPIYYICKVSGYRITSWSGYKGITIEKDIYINRILQSKKIIFCSINGINDLGIDDICKNLTNKKWFVEYGLAGNRYNLLLMREMKRKLIKSLLWSGHIVYDGVNERNEDQYKPSNGECHV